MEEERKQHEEEECTCGHFLDTRKSETSALKQSSSKAAMDSSFVHLPAHLSQPVDDVMRKPRIPMSFATSPSSLDTYQHLQELIRAAQNGGDGVRLCGDCISRVERALDADSERLENECLMYEQTANKEEQRLESLEKALSSVSMSSSAMVDPYDTSRKGPANNNIQTAEQAYRDEVRALEEECRQQEAELMHLKTLRSEQVSVAQDLTETEYELETQKNALELEARAFNNDQQQLFSLLQDIDAEVDKLSSDISLPAILLDLQVDKERGLRYPLINELRLAYRPKGDIKWNEIQVAWSLAAQLLLVVGTLFNYPSEQWKIVPLSHCAKLIFFSEEKGSEGEGNQGRQRRAVVYHLGHQKTNGAKAIRAWNTLLHQVIQHVSSKTLEELQKGAMVTPFPKLPFAITPDTIGTIDLTQLNENDDAGWSRAIHFMASDLLWLSECAALYTSQQVLWTSAVLQAFQA